MATNQTAYSAQAVQSTSQEHDQLADTIKQQLGQLKQEIESTLQASSSDMTHALDSTFDEFSTEVQSAVVANMHTMADDMRQALSGQQNANDSAGSGVKTAGSGMGSFLSGSSA